MIRLSVRSTAMVSSVGSSALECSASVRAGIARVADTAVMSRGRAPLRMALVPDDALPALALVDDAARPTRHRRILRLAHAAIVEACDAVGARAVSMVIATSIDADHAALLLDDLETLAGGRLDRATSRHLHGGAAGAFAALVEASRRIEQGVADAVLVVGADSHLDLVRLDALQRSRRILVDEVMDGFIPGEGAAAVLVSGERSGAVATIARSGLTEDPFRVEGDAPLRGDGLTAALHEALVEAGEPVTDVWAGLDGASWTAREWGLGARRIHRSLAHDLRVHHPVESFGAPGAALGAMLVVLAAVGLQRGTLRGPCLAWALSDDGLRGAARIERSR